MPAEVVIVIGQVLVVVGVNIARLGRAAGGQVDDGERFAVGIVAVPGGGAVAECSLDNRPTAS